MKWNPAGIGGAHERPQVERTVDYTPKLIAVFSFTSPQTSILMAINLYPTRLQADLKSHVTALYFGTC